MFKLFQGAQALITLLLVIVASILLFHVYVTENNHDNIKGNAATATALATDPADCHGDTFANGISAKGDLHCAKLPGSASSSKSSGQTTLSNVFVGNTDIVAGLPHTPSACEVGAFADFLAADGDLGCSRNGAGLHHLHANNIDSGTLSDARLSSNVALLDRDNQTFTGSNIFNANLTVNGTTNLNGDVNLGSDSSDNITVNGRLYGENGGPVTVGHFVNQSGFKVWGDTDLRGQLLVGGFGSVNNGITIQNAGTLYVDGTSEFNGDVTFDGRLLGANGTDPVVIGHYSNPVGLKVWGNTNLRGDLTVGGFGASNAGLVVKGDSTLGDSSSDTTTVNGAFNVYNGDGYFDQGLTVNGALTGNSTADFSGNVTAPLFIGDLQGNADTATAFNHDPTDCTVSNTYATAIDSGGNLTCSGLPSNVAYTDAANVFTAPQAVKANDSSAFLVQTAALDPVLNVDSSLGVVTFGSPTYGVTVDLAFGDLDLNNGGISASGTINATGGFVGDLNGNADTASAFNHDPTDCAAGAFANAINSLGNLSCSTDGTSLAVSGSNVSGDVSGKASNVTGVVAVLNGGTGASDAAGARTNLGLGSMAIQDSSNVNISGGNISGIALTGSTIDNSVTGNGSGISSVDAAALQGNNSSYFTNASNITSGTLSDSRLSTNVTLQGNSFNGASELVKLDGSGKLPAIDGSQLTGLTLSQISGAGTIASQNANSIAVTGGAIDNTVIGGTTPAAVSTTNLTSTGVVDFTGSTSFKVQVVAIAITDNVSTCTQTGRILFTTVGSHFFGCDGVHWQVLDN